MELQYQKTLEKYKNIAGKWCVRVAISDDEAIFLKFQEEPTEEMVKAEVSKFIQNKSKELERELENVNEQIQLLQDRKEFLESKISPEPQA